MPVYRYEAKGSVAGCEGAPPCALCHEGFEVSQRMSDAALAVCPKCGAAVVKVPVVSAFARAHSSFDDRAKNAGFSKLKKVSKGEYEKQY